MPNSNKNSSKPNIFYKVDIVVIGAGQAGLSTAYHLKREGIEPGSGFVVLDDEFGPGGAWQHRWDSLTLSNVNGINDLPGMKFADAVETENTELQANTAVPKYYEHYEKSLFFPFCARYRLRKTRDCCWWRNFSGSIIGRNFQNNDNNLGHKK